MGVGCRARRLVLFAFGAAYAFFLAASSALAEPHVDGEFGVSGLATYNQITTGPDGNIWVTLDDATNDVARITPAGEVQEFNSPDMNQPVGITTFGNDLWVTQSGGVASFSPSNPAGAVATPTATISQAQEITVGPDGHLWTASGANVVEIVPGAPPNIEAHAGFVAGARGIAAGGDGNIWVADQGGSRIVSLTTAGLAAPGSPYGTGTGSGPQDIAAGPGTQMAFTDPLSPTHQLGRITPGAATLFTPIPTSDPFGITLGPDGAYWIGQLSTNNLGRLTPEGAYTTLGGFTAAGNRGPRQLIAGPDNTLWVTLESPGNLTGEAVARVSGFVEPGAAGAPDNNFEFGKVKKNKKKGTARQTVIVPGPGEVLLAATKKVKGDVESAAAAGEVKLKVKPKGKADRKLEEDGKAKVGLEVTYTPTGGDPNTKAKKLKLVQRG